MKQGKNKVLFLHGLESLPGGTKVQHLRKEGYYVLNPLLPRSSFEESCNIAQAYVTCGRPDIIVGSSRGGAVAMNIDTLGARLVLIAPAWTHYPIVDAKFLPESTTILHSTHDDVVKIQDSESLATTYGLSLLRCGNDHRMSDDSALEALDKVIGEIS